VGYDWNLDAEVRVRFPSSYRSVLITNRSAADFIMHGNSGAYLTLVGMGK